MKNKLTTYLLVAFAMMLFVAGCTKIDDLYKETDKQTSPMFSDSQGIPSNFNWSMVKPVDVRIAVDDKFNGRYFYKVELFDNDPVFGNGANLLGAGQAKQGQDFVSQIVVPTALEYVYLKTTSPVGIPAVSMISVKDVSKATVSSTGRAQANTREAVSVLSGGNLRAGASGTGTYTTTSAPSVTVPAGAIELVGNTDYGWNAVNANKNFVVKAGTTFTGNVTLNSVQGVKIYVEGTWERSTIDLGATSGIYVLPGGNLKLSSKLNQSNGGFFENYGTAEIREMPITSNVTYKNYGSLMVSKSSTSNGGKFFNYGTANIDDELISNSQSDIIQNEGTLTVKKATISGGGKFFNHGTGTIDELISRSPNTIVRNEGSLFVKLGNITNASAVEAACHTVFETLKTNGAKLSVLEGSLWSIGNLEAEGTLIDLAPSSIFDVTILAKFGNSANTMQGPANGSEAVARLKKVESAQAENGGITYSRRLEVVCSDHTANGQWSRHYTIISPAVMVPYDQSTVVVTGTACNAGGNNDAGAGTNPDDQTVTEVNLGTYSYAFEDNWPSFGDYDMNDFVTDMNITKYQNSANKVTKVQLKANLRSVGASKRLAASVQLDGIRPDNIKSVTYSNPDLVNQQIALGPNGVETGQTYAVVTICEDAHRVFGVSGVGFISTQDGSTTPREVIITIEFNTPLENFTYTSLNVFIINFLQNIGGRNEIHLVGYQPTDKMNKSLVAYQTETTGQLTVGDPFKSHDGYPWGLCVPASFVYPREGKNISDVYTKFRSWAESGGVEDADWYVR